MLTLPELVACVGFGVVASFVGREYAPLPLLAALLYSGNPVHAAFAAAVTVLLGGGLASLARKMSS